MEGIVYVLLSDGDGTMHSVPTPFGVAVTTKEEAERFALEAPKGYGDNSYSQLRVFKSFQEGLDWYRSENERQREEARRWRNQQLLNPNP